MSPQNNKGKKATGAAKVKNAGLTVDTKAAKNTKVPWIMNNSAPATRKETGGFSAAFQKSAKRARVLASADWRSAIKTPADNEDNKNGHNDDGNTGQKSAASKENQTAANGEHEDHIVVENVGKSLKFDEEFFQAIHKLPNFTHRIIDDGAKTAGMINSSRVSPVPELSLGGASSVKIENIGKVVGKGGTDDKKSASAQEMIFWVTPVTSAEMKYISSTDPVMRTPLAELHVAKHRARKGKSEDDLDAYHVAKALKPIPRMASISPEFLKEDAGARLDTVERLRGARRLQEQDPAALWVGCDTGSDEMVLEQSPHRVRPTKDEDRENRDRFATIIKRLHVPQGEATTGGAPTRPDSGYSSPPGDKTEKTADAAGKETTPSETSGHDSGFESPTGTKTLDPKAQEFVSMKSMKNNDKQNIEQTPTKRVARPGKPARKPVFGGFFGPRAKKPMAAPFTSMNVPKTVAPFVRPFMRTTPPKALSNNSNLVGGYAMPANTMPQPTAPMGGFRPFIKGFRRQAPRVSQVPHIQQAQHIPQVPFNAPAHMVPGVAPVPMAHHPMAPVMAPNMVPGMVPGMAPMPTPMPAPMMPMGHPLPAPVANGYCAPVPAPVPPFVATRPAPPCAKPRNPDPIAQQQYEAYIEQRKAMDPAYALECKRRQARRWQKQQQLKQEKQAA